MKRKKPEPTPAPARVPPAWPAALLIVVAGLLAYSNSFRGVFVLDDVRAIVRNESIRALTPVSRPLSPPPMSTVSGRPLANLSFAVNYAISTLDVGSYHAVNLLIHLATALALFGVIRRTLIARRLAARFAQDATFIAGAVALLWVVHPLTTSAVTYIVQRVESLMSMFYVLTLYCSIQYFEGSGSLRPARAAAEGRGRLQPAWAAAAIVSCALGMATKEVMVTAPVAVALWHAVFHERERTRGKWKLLAGLCATWLVSAFLISGEQREASIAWSTSTAWRYLLTQAEVITHYLSLVFIPSPLIFLYTWPLVRSIGDAIPEVFLIGALLGVTLFGLWKRHPAGFAAAMFSSSCRRRPPLSRS